MEDRIIKTVDQMFERLYEQVRWPAHRRWEPIYVSTKIRAATLLANRLSFVNDGKHVPIEFKSMKGGVWEVDIA